MFRRGVFVAVLLTVLLVAASPAAAEYQFQFAWGTAGSQQGQLSGVQLIASAPDGTVYVADTGNQRVQQFAADGTFIAAIGGLGSGSGQFNSPNGVAVGPDGSVYVTDSGNHRVQRFNGGTVTEWGTLGSGPGQFGGITGIATASDGSVFVGDVDNRRVEKFLSDGTYANIDIVSGAGGFGTISGVAVGPDGSVYVVDQANNRVERFDINGTFLGTWGSQGTGPGQFSAPRGVAASAAGVYVVDSSNSRIQKFTADGAFVDSFNAATAGDPALSGPIGIAISPTTGLIYVSQPARVSSYSESGGANLPPPSTGETANAQPVNGTVRVKQPGSSQFTLLTAGTQIPIGSIVDVTTGTVDLTTTAGDKTTQTARFYAGVFKLTQKKAAKPVTELQLFGGNFKSCPKPSGKRSASGSASKKRVVRQLWGSGKGRFRTKGKYAAASIRGTQWLTQDRCDGTLTRVTEGSVTVRDLVRSIDKVVSAGKSYLARARKS